MKENNHHEVTLDPTQGQALGRRAFLTGAAAVSAVAVSGPAFAQASGGPKNAGIVDAAIDCMEESEVCMAHCLRTFNEGDTMLAKCATLVNETSIVCLALAKLAAAGSAHLAETAKLSIATCKDCEAECRRHASHHDECKACADSCVACIKACEALAA